MSPSAALESPIFRIYATIAIVLSRSCCSWPAARAIQILKRTSNRNLEHAWNSYRGWLIMIPLVFGAIFLRARSDDRLFHAAGHLWRKEFARATGLYRDWAMMGGGLCFDRRLWHRQPDA